MLQVSLSLDLGGGGGTDPKIARGCSARGKKLDPPGSVCRKNGGQKDLDITESWGQKDLWNIHLVKNIFLGALPKLGVEKICRILVRKKLFSLRTPKLGVNKICPKSQNRFGDQLKAKCS